MFAKQTIWSASLVVVFAGATVVAHADPERPATGTFEVGAGFSSIEGFIARAAVEQSSLFGSGHYLRLDATISRWRQDFGIKYGTPDLGGGLSLSTEMWARTRQLPAFVRSSTGFAFALQKRFSPNVRAFVGYKQEYVERPITAKLSSVSLGMIYETDRTNAGMVYELADRRLGSDYTFDRMHAWIRHSEPLGPFILHARAQGTQLLGQVPTSELLFIDGVTDLRGYERGALMPLGGTSKVGGSLELELPLSRRYGISAAGFVDAGGLMGRDALDRNVGVFGASAGVGLRWRSPIGTLTFDWAVPLDGGAPRFLFGIGGPW